MEEIQADVLVAGGGLAGLMAAMRAHLAGAEVVLLTGRPGASDRMAGFSTALSDAPEDRPEDLFNDMFVAGGFLSNPTLLAAIVERIGPETRFLEALGVPFHRKDGKLARRQAAGVSWPRAVFTLDMVGMEAAKRLVQKLEAAEQPRVRVLKGAVLLDLHVEDGLVVGGLVYRTPDREWAQVRASAVVVATGGGGQLFQKTTNFPGIQGTGYAVALEAGAPLVDMEFVSYEPTVAVAGKVTGMELPTMAFSEGARLLNGRGEEFIRTSPPASKDVMSRAMLREVREGRGTPNSAIFYDLRKMAPEAALGYSQIRRVLKAVGLSSQEAQIEVMPTQHFLMGGIATDEHGAAQVPGLYAAGEAAGGAHGAHRLATCGGTEVIAMGAIAGESAAGYACGRKRAVKVARAVPRPELLPTPMDAKDEARVAAIRSALEQGCGALRERQGLKTSLAVLNGLRDELKDEGRLQTFVGRAVLTALSIASSALARGESRGDHFRMDWPQRDDRQWLGNIWTSLAGAEVALSFRRAGIAQRAATRMPGVSSNAG